ncbi:MAG: hypothetical protein VW378_03175 [bacterium]
MTYHHQWLSVILICLLFPYLQYANTKYQTIRNPFVYGDYQQKEIKHPVKKNKKVGPVKRNIKVNKKTKKTLNLHGIIQTQTGLIALINQKSMSNGDTIEGWKVTTIDKNSVVLKKGTLRKRLKMK